MVLRVLQIHEDVNMGGTARLLEHLINNSDKEVFKYGICSLCSYQDRLLKERLNDLGVPTFNLGGKVGFKPYLIPRLRELFRQFKPDIIHTHNHAVKYAAPACFRLGISGKIHTLHTTQSLGQRRYYGMLSEIANSLALNLGKFACVAVSNFQLDRITWTSTWRCEISVIHNGVNISSFEPRDHGNIRTRLNLKDSEFAVVSTGRLAPEKDHKTLLKAIQIVQKKAPNIKLLVAGDGPLRSKLESEATKMGLQKKVEFLGAVSCMPEVLGASDVFVSTSLIEALPFGILEAMAAGLPIIATNVGGVPELIVNGVSGLLFEPGNQKELANSLLKIYKSVTERVELGRQAHKRVVNQFSVDKMVNAYESLYRQVVNPSLNDRF